MVWRLRSWWAALAVVAYVGAAAVRAAPQSRLIWVAVAVSPLLLWLGWRMLAPPPHGADRISGVARAGGRLAATGAPIVLVAELGPKTASFEAAQVAGLACASVGSLLALMRVSSLGGIAARPVRPRLDALILCALTWAAVLMVLLARIVAIDVPPEISLLASDYGRVVAALVSLGLTLIVAARLYVQRRFELGVAERASAAAWLSVLCLVIGVLATLMEVTSPERIVPATALAAALCVTATSTSQQPTLVSRSLRTLAALTMLCAPLVGVAVVVAYKSPTHAGLILFVVTILAACFGVLSTKVAERLAPERGRWLRALEAALQTAKEPDPNQAMIAVLNTIREALPRQASQAALHRLASGDVLTVDRAGYLHIDPADVPERLVDIGMQEPERILACEAMRYIQVHRPEVRGVVDWLDEREIGVVALVVDDDICVGLLLWPSAGRDTPLSFEEVRAFRQLADNLGAASGASSQLARSRARELQAEHAVEAAEQRISQLETRLSSEAGRHRAQAQQHARAVEVACYSPAAQTAAITLERLAPNPIALIAEPGVDVVPWAALFHLASERAGGPLWVVDGSTPGDRDMALWNDPVRSPMVAAKGGTLVVLNTQLLAADTQRYVGMRLPADTGLVVSLPGSASPEAALEALDEHLLDRVGGRVVPLPCLADRAEDLRALALYCLAGIGQRARGKAYGLSLGGQQLLNEYGWPGNEAEFEAVLLRATLVSDGDVVQADVLADMIGEAPHSQSDKRPSGPQRRAGS